MIWKDMTVSTNFDASLICEEISEGKTRIQLEWENVESEKPALEIRWSLPLRDIQYCWHPACAKNRSLRVDWQAPISTGLFHSAPVFCFYNEQGRSRLTVALSETMQETLHSYGVHEEDGTLLCRITVPLPVVHSAKAYGLTLMRISEDLPWEEALRCVSAWWEQEGGFAPLSVPEAARLPVYSTWYSFHQDTIAGEIERECQQAREMGFKTVIVDDGWQTTDCSRGYGYCGDWQVAEEKIPDMRAHVEKIHALGMKYMLWYSVPFVGEYSQRWEEFKDMVLCRVEDQHAAVLDPRYPQVRSFLTDTYVQALKAWNLDGFKLDFIDSFVPSSRAPLPREGMDFALVEDAVFSLMTGIHRALTAIKPDVLIEFRQSYIGPAMRSFSNMFRVTDCPADWLSNRVGMVDLRLLSGDTAVHSDMLMWHEEDPVENAARQLLNVFFAVPQISVRAERIPEEHRKMLRFYMDFMARKRELLRSAMQAEAPHMLYPVVRTRLEDEEAAVVYGQNHLFAPSDANNTYLFNATGTAEIVLRNPDKRKWHWETVDCMGQTVGAGMVPAEAFAAIPVPCGGHAVLTRAE